MLFCSSKISIISSFDGFPSHVSGENNTQELILIVLTYDICRCYKAIRIFLFYDYVLDTKKFINIAFRKELKYINTVAAFNSNRIIV